MNYNNDLRTVLTLDAGGTNLAFGAVKANKDLIDSIVLPTNADNLDKCLENIVSGFEQVIKAIPNKPAAISFAFPGPADYENGIIGDLPNFTAFNGKGGVALGNFLKDKFGLPVFINNDGDLFAYGEASSGILPELNDEFAKRKLSKRYNNLLGFTLGTGVGCGLVTNGQLHKGDNGASAEVWTIRNGKYNKCFAEEGVSIRGILSAYKNFSGSSAISPKDIFEIAQGKKEGDIKAAQKTFVEFGEIFGDLIANINAVIDGAIVIGGGIAAAYKYFLPSVMKQLNGTIYKYGEKEFVPRMESKAFDMQDSKEFEAFFSGNQKKVKVPYSNQEVDYNEDKRIPIFISKLSATRAIHLGAYAFALNAIDKG